MVGERQGGWKHCGGKLQVSIYLVHLKRAPLLKIKYLKKVVIKYPAYSTVLCAMENLGSPRIAQGYQVPVTVGNSQMAPVYAGPDQDSFPSEVTFSPPVSILLDLHIFPN